MKYACFSGEDYEPSGGWNDCDGVADDLESAKQLRKTGQGWNATDWAHIVIFDDNPRVVSFWFRRNFLDLKRRLKGETWYDEDSDGFRAMETDETLQYSNMEPFEPHLVEEWQNSLRTRGLV